MRSCSLTDWFQAHWRRCVWLLGYACVLAYLTVMHFYFVRLIQHGYDDSLNRWESYARACKPFRFQIVVYLVAMTAVSLVMAFLVLYVVVRHWKEPAYRVLLPPYLCHLCVANFVVPVFNLFVQLQHLYLAHAKWSTALAFYLDGFNIFFLSAAVVGRLRLMYLFFIVGRFDANYGWIVCRVLVISMTISLASFVIVFKEDLFYLAGLLIRTLAILIIFEVMYYNIRLRNTRYLRDLYIEFLCACGMAIVALLYLSVLLTYLDSHSQPMDQFNSIWFVVWLINAETVFPTMSRTLRAHIHRNSRLNYEKAYGDLNMHERSRRTGIEDILSDQSMYNIVLALAEDRFCDENLLFLHDGRKLYKSLKVYTDGLSGVQSVSAGDASSSHVLQFVKCEPSGDPPTSEIDKRDLKMAGPGTHHAVDVAPMECLNSDSVVSKETTSDRLLERVHEFLDNYVMSDAANAVNLASYQISGLRAARNANSLCLFDHDKFMQTLLLSLADVEMLFESSGVLGTFERSDAKAAVIAEREAAIKIGMALPEAEPQPDET